MGFMDQLKKLTQPMDGEDDFFEGADPSYRPKPKTKPETKPNISAAQAAFESSFADNNTPYAPEQEERPAAAPGGIFGGLAQKMQSKPKAAAKSRANAGIGSDSQVMLFSPTDFDEAGELVNFLNSNLTVVMTLESVQGDTARRLLDFLSGIAYALGGKITPVSAKTYFITPQNVDILGTQAPEQPETTGHYL